MYITNISPIFSHLSVQFAHCILHGKEIFTFNGLQSYPSTFAFMLCAHHTIGKPSYLNTAKILSYIFYYDCVVLPFMFKYSILL